MVSHGSMIQDPFCVMRLPTTEQSSLLTRWHMHRNQYDRTGSVHKAVYFVSSEISFATETVVLALKRLVGVFLWWVLENPASSHSFDYPITGSTNFSSRDSLLTHSSLRLPVLLVHKTRYGLSVIDQNILYLCLCIFSWHTPSRVHSPEHESSF